jgi:predicted amidohydrolase YtcJ
MDLLTNSAANEAGTAERGENAWYRVYAWGDFDGATAQVQLSPDGVEYDAFDTASLAFTTGSTEPQEVYISRDEWVRAATTGGAETTQDVTVRLVRLYRERV